jgi:hypothetical protein
MPSQRGAVSSVPCVRRAVAAKASISTAPRRVSDVKNVDVLRTDAEHPSTAHLTRKAFAEAQTTTGFPRGSESVGVPLTWPAGLDPSPTVVRWGLPVP